MCFILFKIKIVFLERMAQLHVIASLRLQHTTNTFRIDNRISGNILWFFGNECMRTTGNVIPRDDKQSNWCTICNHFTPVFSRSGNLHLKNVDYVDAVVTNTKNTLHRHMEWTPYAFLMQTPYGFGLFGG